MVQRCRFPDREQYMEFQSNLYPWRTPYLHGHNRRGEV